MLGSYTRATFVVAALLLPGALALGDATRVYYLYEDGALMTEGAPANEDPTGLETLYFEREGQTHDSALELSAPLSLAISGAFQVQLWDRQGISPLERVYRTEIKIFLQQPNGQEVMSGIDRWYAGDHGTAFLHPGGEIGPAEGWTDFHFDANSTLPTHNTCNPNGCVTVANGVITIPKGVKLRMEVGLVAPPSCALELCSTYDAAFELAADQLVATTDDLNAFSPVDLYDPLGPIVGPCGDASCFDPIHTELEKRLRDQNGEFLGGMAPASILPVSSWRTASTTSDSHLAIRLA